MLLMKGRLPDPTAQVRGRGAPTQLEVLADQGDTACHGGARSSGQQVERTGPAAHNMDDPEASFEDSLVFDEA